MSILLYVFNWGQNILQKQVEHSNFTFTYYIILYHHISQSEHIGQWATPHHLSDVRRGAPSWIWDYLAHACYTLHDRRWGGIGRVVPNARCSRCSDWFVIAERLSYVSVRTIFQRRRFGLDICFHLIHPRHDRRLGGIGRVARSSDCIYRERGG